MSKLTLGPLFFQWKPEQRRDMYFRIADEAPIDCVYLGEVVCSKREPLYYDYLPEIVERLSAAGKQVVLSTLALITSDRELAAIAERCGEAMIVEANDVASISLLKGRPHITGPFINVFNEATLDFLVRQGAIRVNLPVELSGTAIATLARHNPVETEVLVFGRQPLSVSMRCYHSRAYGVHKESCQFVCETDPDGLAASQLTGAPLLRVNGTQTMSHGYAVLLRELTTLQTAGVTHFRLSPQVADMVQVAEIYRSVLDGDLDAASGEALLHNLTGETPYVNGYVRGREGMAWAET
ncbi:MAG: U32 family peptidase [Acetobacteraceae bacterium]|nr:U32 family peptidase [Acetobacteraceae bacterium]